MEAGRREWGRGRREDEAGQDEEGLSGERWAGVKAGMRAGEGVTFDAIIVMQIFPAVFAGMGDEEH